MSKPKPNLLLMVAIAICATAFVLNIAYGQDHGCQGGHNCNGGGDVIVDTVLTGGDIGGDSSKALGLGFSHSLGDVDINDCLASTQKSNILFGSQIVGLNKWCAAEVYDAKRLPDMAAKLRCDIPEISKHFTTFLECTAANTTSLKNPPDYLNLIAELKADYSALSVRVSAAEERTVNAEVDARKARSEAQRATTAAKTSQSNPDNENERRARARAALKGEE